MISVQCNCGAKLNVKDEYAGKKGKCPKCGQAIEIPAIVSTEVPVAAVVQPDIAFAPVSQTPSSPQDFDVPEINPYQAPQSPLTPSPLSLSAAALALENATANMSLQVIGEHVVGPTPMILPMKCIYCGNDLTQKEHKTRTIYYTPAWAYWVGGAIMMMLVRKPCKITFGLCKEHRSQRNRKILILSLALFFSFFGFMAAFIAGAASRKLEIPFMVLGVLLIGAFIACLIGLGRSSQLLAAKKYDNGIFYIKGCKQGFLNLFSRR